MAASFRHFTTLRNWPNTVVLLSANMTTYRMTTHFKDQKFAFFNSYLERKKFAADFSIDYSVRKSTRLWAVFWMHNRSSIRKGEKIKKIKET